MTATTVARLQQAVTGDLQRFQKFPIQASTSVKAGWLLTAGRSGMGSGVAGHVKSLAAADAATHRFVGVCEEDCDNSSGSAGDKSVKVIVGRYGFQAVGSSADADWVGKMAYAIDNQTVQVTDTLSGFPIGPVVGVDSATVVWVQIDPSLAFQLPEAPEQSITMAGTTTLLTTGAESSGNVLIDSKTLRIDPTGNRTLVLPAEAECVGLSLRVRNTADAAETITITDDGSGTVAKVDRGELAILFCDGTNWYAAKEDAFAKLGIAPQAESVAANQTLLITGSAGSNEILIASRTLVVTTDQSRDVTLPAEALCMGLWFRYVCVAQPSVIKNAATSTIVTLAAGEHAVLWCDGTTWRGDVSQAT